MNGHCGLVNTHVNALTPWKALQYWFWFGCTKYKNTQIRVMSKNHNTDRNDRGAHGPPDPLFCDSQSNPSMTAAQSVVKCNEKYV